MQSQAHAAAALRQSIRPTVWIQSQRLSQHLRATVTLASETFQITGSFKYRAACQVVASTPQPRLITASSGNFGQALACAAAQLGKRCTVVMPADSARVKIDAVREHGAVVDLIDVRTISRAQRVAELARLDPDARVASAYDDPAVIDGNATLGAELAAAPCDFVLAPVGGGGLSAGLVQGLRAAGSPARVIGVEPRAANDAARSLRAGRLLANDAEPITLADGVRTLSLGRHNWEILRDGLDRIIEVSEDSIRTGVRLLFELANLKAEPTGALPIAALLEAPPGIFAGRRVVCVISGGNVDPQLYATILTGAA